MKYEVTVVRTGRIFVEADNPEEAMNIANLQQTGAIDWCDEWEATDCEEDELPDTHEKLFGYIKKD